MKQISLCEQEEQEVVFIVQNMIYFYLRDKEQTKTNM